MVDQGPNDLAAGWYPDTDLVNTERYWDGKSWTNKRRATNVSSDKPAHKVISSTSPSGNSKIKGLWHIATGKPGETKNKKAIRRIITFILLMAILSNFGSDSETSTSSSPTVSESPAPVASESPTVEATPTVEASPTESVSPTPVPLSPVQFRVSALGDISDMRKDFSDFEVVLNKGGLFRLLGNILEIEFNIGQLQSLTPPDMYSVKFTEKLASLELAVDDLSDAVTDSESSISNTKSKLGKCRSALNSLESYVKSVN
jgi:hypothetical protein